MWQVSGAHGAIDPMRAVDAMSAYHDAGFTTWDLADHYRPAEEGTIASATAFLNAAAVTLLVRRLARSA
jgi:aryl-alcohol dehydrogenase-like predicted oxidoreductase